MDKDQLDGFPAFAVELAQECAGMTLLDADRALDDARRYLWMWHFGSGPKNDPVPPLLAAAHRIASRMHGVFAPLEVDDQLLEVRLYLWACYFESKQGSRFKEQLTASGEGRRAGPSIH